MNKIIYLIFVFLIFIGCSTPSDSSGGGGGGTSGGGTEQTDDDPQSDVLVLGSSFNDAAADIRPTNIYTTDRNHVPFTVLCFDPDQIQEGDYLYFSKKADDTRNIELSIPGKKGITCEFYNVRVRTGVLEDSVIMVYADRDGFVIKEPFNIVAVFNGGKDAATQGYGTSGSYVEINGYRSVITNGTF